jgi:LPXTG-motif cell wall-anchored protein
MLGRKPGEIIKDHNNILLPAIMIGVLVIISAVVLFFILRRRKTVIEE